MDKEIMDEAEKQFRKGLRLDPECESALCYLGDLYFRKKKWKKAVSIWKKMIGIAPETIDFMLGRFEDAFFMAGKYDKLVEFYDQLIPVAGNKSGLLLALARVKEKMGNMDEAVELAGRAAKEEPGSINVRGRFIELLHRADKDDDAIDESLDFFGGWKSGYVCPWCGFESENYLWRCPGCMRWKTFRPEGNVR